MPDLKQTDFFEEISFGEITFEDISFEDISFEDISCKYISCEDISFEDTVKLGNKEWFDKEQIGIKEPFPLTKCQFTS